MHSKLLPLLFERIDSNRRLTIFDIGPATPETVDFFSQFKCRIFFADLFSEQIANVSNKNLDEKAMQRQFQTLLAYPANTQFDICLFWDYLNYLEPQAIRALSSVLQPFIHQDSRGHGFAAFNVTTQLANQQYGMQQIDKLTVKRRIGQPLACYPHSQAELKKLLHCFNINKGTLLPDGRLEILLHAATIKTNQVQVANKELEFS